MKFKIKINSDTTLKDILHELDELKTANVNELPLNHLLKIIDFLGAVQVPTTGSSLTFKHPLLNKHPYYHGFFSVHKIHKGGDNDLIRRTDFKSYLLPALLTIIEFSDKK